MVFCSHICLFTLLLIASEAYGQSCANGNKLVHIGTSRIAADKIADIHNMYRMKIVKGQVSGQPQGTNLLRMSYDKTLENKARAVSLTCDFNHVEIHDNRWEYVGQNLYIEYSKSQDSSQNWEAAVKAWFDENKEYTYSTGFSPNTGHYTQVVWADSYKVGCDFVMFYDAGLSMHSKMYTCNYGPGGNVMGQYPYKVDDSSECHNLC